MWMDLIPRIQGILLKPKDEWEKIKGEDLPVQSLFTSYAMIVAAIPAIAQFIGNGLIGRSVLSFGWYRRPIGSALLQAVLFYIFSLVTVYVLGIIINSLAPTFSSKQNQNNAMKIAVFSMTAAWVAGIFYIIPFLGVLAILGALYGFYILYLGFDASLMDTPKEKVVGYFVVSLVVAFVLYFLISVILGAIFAVGAVGGLY